MRRSLVSLLTLICGFIVSGCAKHEHPAGDHGHTHQAPHGGTLLEIGTHAFNLEVVRDPTAGKLTVYVLDGHAENFVRIAPRELQATAYSGGQRRVLALQAVANPATGETVGSTSQFEGQADWLKQGGALNGEVGPIEIRGTNFPPVAFQLK
jgi:hypothetical protein